MDRREATPLTWIALAGFMGTGKTRIGRLLSYLLSLNFIDTDEVIEKITGLSVADIFRTRGEAAFRAYEREVVRRVVRLDHAVVALGGGAIVDPASRRLLRGRGPVVTLAASPQSIYRRTRRQQRPLLQVPDPVRRIEELLAQRRAAYEDTDLQVSTDGHLPLDTARLIVDLLWHKYRPGDTTVPALRPVPEGADADWDEDAEDEVPEVTERCQVEVALGERSYAVVIGPGALEEYQHLPARQTVIITDSQVAALYSPKVQQALGGADLISIPPGETSKNLTEADRLYQYLAEQGLDRTARVVALGGGVVGDLAGFVAATYARGLFLVQIPTTLLAMVDSSVGGKVAVNLPQGKNLVGAFHQPELVLADPTFLTTLPVRERVNGLVEMFKHSLLEGGEHLALIRDHLPHLLDGRGPLVDAVARSVAFKAGVVSRDEWESGERAKLNLGHTLGHALEIASEHALSHGEAVAFGLAYATRLSQALGLGDLVSLVDDTLKLLPLPALPPLEWALVRQAMSTDKKRASGQLRWILLVAPGQVEIRGDVPEELLEPTWQGLVGRFR